MIHTNDPFSVRYVKLFFTIRFNEKTVLPKYKASALRGGMGEMLLRVNCVRNRQCNDCDFESECLVRRIVYSKMDIQPRFMSSGDSVGYVLECEDYREDISAGALLNFQMILFGKTIVYFGQILDAFFRLGRSGIGKYKSRFDIVRIANSINEPILSRNNLYMDRYLIRTIQDYVDERKEALYPSTDGYKVSFHAPLTLRIQGENMTDFDMGAILTAAGRRLYILDCFEGIEAEQINIAEQEIPEGKEQKRWIESMPRFSNRKSEKMTLRGIRGNILIDAVCEDVMELLIAGELMHIGKNTSFGFGRYSIEVK